MIKRLTYAIVLLALPAWGDGPLLLLAPQSDEERKMETTDDISRTHVLTIQRNALNPDMVRVGDWVTVEPSPGLVLTGVVTSATTDINGVFSIIVSLDEPSDGVVLLSTSGGETLGSVELPRENRRFVIRYDGAARRHFSRDVRAGEEDELDDLPPPIPPRASGKSLSMPDSVNRLNDVPAAKTTIDAMIVYTTNAMNWAGGQSGINNVMAQAISRGQLTLDNSQAEVKLRLVHSAVVDYVEGSGSGTDLDRLTNPADGYIDIIHTWRSTYGADLVAMFTYIEDTGGIGWLLTSASGQPAWAFSISRVQQAATSYTTIHEMGHNMGCHHRRDQATQPGPGLYSYSAGWRWIGTNNVKYCSVMSYTEDGYARVGYFSSPLVSYRGRATGTVTDDNARTIRNVKDVVAAYRPTTVPEVGTNAFWFRATALTNNIYLRWSDPIDCGVSTRLVRIRYDTSDYPDGASDGPNLIYSGTNRFYEHAGLVPNQPYYYTLWVTQDGVTYTNPP